MAGFTQAVFLAGAALILVFQSIDRLIDPALITSVDFGLGVVVVSLVAAACLVVMQTWVVKKTGSTAIAADRAHYLTDVAVNVAVLFALGVTKLTGWTRADPVFALAISLYMVWGAYGISQQALTQLLDANCRRRNGNASGRLCSMRWCAGCARSADTLCGRSNLC